MRQLVSELLFRRTNLPADNFRLGLRSCVPRPLPCLSPALSFLFYRILKIWYYFHEVRMLVNGILVAFKSLMWVAVLLVSLMFICAVILTNLFAPYRDLSPPPLVDAEWVSEFWGDTASSMITMMVSQSVSSSGSS